MRRLVLWGFVAFGLAGLVMGEPPWLAKGDAADARGEHEEALAAYLEAERLKPNDAEILWRVAKQYSQMMAVQTNKKLAREYGARALESAERSVQIDPKNSKGRLTLAIVLGRVALHEPPQRKVEMSRRIREEAEAAVAINPREGLAWHVLGRWHYELANFNPVLRSLAEVVYGGFPDASNKQAAHAFEQAIAVGPPKAINHIEYGRALAALGRKEDAKREIQRGLRMRAADKDDEEAQKRGRELVRKL